MINREKPTLIIMAAGMGSRYGGLKQVDRITDAGEIILDFSLYDAMMAGFGRAVFVIKEEHRELFRELVDERAGRFMETEYAYQKLDDIPEGVKIPDGREKPWGTGHAVLACRELIKGPFAVINADDYYGPGAYVKMAEFLDSGGTDYALAGYRLKNTLSQNGGVSRGICSFDSDMFMTGVREYTDLKPAGASGVSSAEGACFTGEELVSLNFWAFRHEFMDLLSEYFGDFIKENINDSKSEFYLPSAVNRAVGEGRAKVRVIPVDEIWQGVTYKADKPAVEDFLRKNRKGFA